MSSQNKLSELIVYTSTLYGDDETSKIRSKLCLNLLKNAKGLGIKVVVRDGGSSDKFIDEVNKLDNVLLIQALPREKRKSMGADRRDALAEAVRLANREKMENPYFFWTEPEKDDLISEKNLVNIITGIRCGSNIVVPAREEGAWQNLPKNQRWFEQRANKRSLELIKESSGGRHQQLLDLWFGPKMFDRVGAEFFQKYNEDGKKMDLWDATIVPVVEAIREGKAVGSVPVDYKYNETQALNESGELKNAFIVKRSEQYAQILREMGDPVWETFFQESKDELNKIKELKKESTVESAELLNEQKKIVLKSFFKIR